MISGQVGVLEVVPGSPDGGWRQKSGARKEGAPQVGTNEQVTLRSMEVQSHWGTSWA